jgi:hypothetical protein
MRARMAPVPAGVWAGSVYVTTAKTAADCVCGPPAGGERRLPLTFPVTTAGLNPRCLEYSSNIQAITRSSLPMSGAGMSASNKARSRWRHNQCAGETAFEHSSHGITVCSARWAKPQSFQCRQSWAGGRGGLSGSTAAAAPHRKRHIHAPVWGPMISFIPCIGGPPQHLSSVFARRLHRTAQCRSRVESRPAGARICICGRPCIGPAWPVHVRCNPMAQLPSFLPPAIQLPTPAPASE